jgi:ABC-type phosphate transport system auxiliary subunit
MQFLSAFVVQLPKEFWPTSALGWLTLIGLLVGGAAAVWRFTKLVHELNGLGERVNVCEDAHKAIEVRMTNVERAQELAALDRANMREAFGRLASQVETLVQLTQKGRDERHTEHMELRERLVRIETLVMDGRTTERRDT